MLNKGVEPLVVPKMARVSVEMVEKNYYELHAVERSRAVELLPSIKEQEKRGKVIGIDGKLS